MKTGRLTIPTDENYFDGTKRLVKKWGADAVRDCDGTELPANVAELATKVYKTYFVVRGDNAYIYAHDESVQGVALISERKTAFENKLEIDLLDGFFDQQIAVNGENYRKYWQVFDRTAGTEIIDWDFDGKHTVTIPNPNRFHEYTVNFFGKVLWDATQIYNYTCNGWTIQKDRDMDPIYPEAFARMEENIDTWLANNPQVSVVRFTTFFYHFILLYYSGTKQKLFDWYNYAMSASPRMFERFAEEYGYELKLEDLLTAGSYGNHFYVPNQARLDYMDLVQRFVSEKMALLVKKVHDAGKEAMMFWGDNWIGAEPYGKHFAQIGLDAVVGSVSSGATVRAVSDIPHLKYKEIRLMPYFFPDTLYDDTLATTALRRNWLVERRALLRKPVDRIGFGGYLRLADQLPNFCDSVEQVCDEFRDIYDAVSAGEPYTALKVAILSYWGREKSWQENMICQDAPFQHTAAYLGYLEALAGLPADIHFVSFNEAIRTGLEQFDIVVNCGGANTSFSGGECWKNERLVSCIREYIANGGGFVGIGEPTAVNFGGRFFQLADALGVDKEIGFTGLLLRHNVEICKQHFITADIKHEIEYADATDHVYALDHTTILDARYSSFLATGVNNCYVKLAVNEYGKGRCFYSAGLGYDAQNARLLYRALLWCAGKEKLLQRAYSNNPATECHYYPSVRKYAITNNTDQVQVTDFYDISGNRSCLTLEAGQLLWLNA